MESLELIDVSGDDDLFLGLSSPPALAQPPDRDPSRAGFRVGAEADAVLDPTGGSTAAAGRASDPDGVAEDQEAPERTESPKQRKAKTGVNLRKSLAWDSAFFTSEGVLDTEELAIVNSTFRKAQGSRLPGITEETSRSGESTTCALESESWVMESVETELFDNVRASIQRSLGKPNKVTAGPPASLKTPRATANAPRAAARKGVERMPQIKVRVPVSTSQGVAGRQRSQVTSKEPTAARANTLPEDGEAKPSSRPPRALPRVATMRSSTNATLSSGISDKRSNTGGVNRQAVGKSATTAGGLPGGVMKSSLVPKSGALTSTSTKPDTKTKTATLNSAKRTAQRIPIRSSSKSNSSKTNLTRSSGNKIPARGTNDRASPTISPNSSIDSMCSVISGASTASTVGKMSHTSESFSSLSASLSPSLRKSNDHPLTTKLRPRSVTEEQYSGPAASGDSLISTAGTTGQGKDSKPSGLRRPNPKKGYFDADKSTDQVQSTKIQLLPPATPKSNLPSAQMTSVALSTFGQQESGASKSRAVKVLSVEVAQMDVVPFKVAEPEACTHETGPVVAPEAEKSFGQQEPKSIAPLEESGTSKSRTVKVLSVEIAQMDAVPFKVAEPEACTHETGPVVAHPEAEKSTVQTVNAQAQQQPMEIKYLLPAAPNSQPSTTHTMILASSSISQKESKSTNEALKVAEQMEVELSPMETIVSTSEALNVAEQMEVEPSPMETIASTCEALNVAEHEVCLQESVSLVAEHSAEKSNGTQVQEEPSQIQLSLPVTPNSQLPSTQTMKTTTFTMDQHELRPTEAPHEESSSLKSKADKVVAHEVAEPFEVANLNIVKTEAVKVVENESVMNQSSPLVITAESSKENIPVLHQNIQADDNASSLSVDLLIQKLSSVSLGPAPESSKENIPVLHQNIQADDNAGSLSVDLLIQKLSSVSFRPASDMTS